MKEYRKYEEALSKLVKAHPRIDTQKYAEVMLAIDAMKCKETKVTNTKLAAFMGEKRGSVARRVAVLELYGYTQLKGRTKSGQTPKFWVVEDESKPLWKLPEKEEAIHTHGFRLLDALRKPLLAKVVGYPLIEKFQRLIASGDIYSAKYIYQQALGRLKNAKLKGSLKFIFTLSSALKVELSAEGEATVELIKEKDAEEEKAKKAAKEKGKGTASSAA